MSQTLITGNTYPHREALRRLGGRWDAAAKGWRVPANRAEEAQKLVSGSGAAQPRAPAGRRASTPAPRRERNPEPPLATGEQIVSRPSQGRDDPGYAVGKTYHWGPRVRGQGGGPDGRYWTVTWGGKARIGEEDDTWADRHGTSWACFAHVRAATLAEAAPLTKQIATATPEYEAVRAAGAAIREG